MTKTTVSFAHRRVYIYRRQIPPLATFLLSKKKLQLTSRLTVSGERTPRDYETARHTATAHSAVSTRTCSKEKMRARARRGICSLFGVGGWERDDDEKSGRVTGESRRERLRVEPRQRKHARATRTSARERKDDALSIQRRRYDGKRVRPREAREARETERNAKPGPGSNRASGPPGLQL